MNKTKRRLTAIVVSLLALSPTFLTPIIAQASFEAFKVRCDDTSNGSTTDSGATSSGKGSGGDWLSKGSEANNNAQAIFDKLTKTVGFSGAGASGALAVAQRESKFQPDAVNTGGGVAGFFQWSGFSNNVNGNRITAEGSIKAGDKSTLTTENELKLMVHELNGSFSKAKKSVGTATDPETGATNWTADYEGVALSDPQTKLPSLLQDAKDAYQSFGGANIPANSALLGGSVGASDGVVASDSTANYCGSGSGEASGIVGVAKELLGYFTYAQVHGETYIGSVDSPIRSGQTDCSGFVWLVLKKAGYKVPDNMGWFTQSMENDAKGQHQWLKEISGSEAKTGDVVIVNTGDGSGSNGHTAILEEDWKSGSPKDNDTKIIQEGGQGGSGGVNEGTFKDSFMGLLGGSYSITFARPIK